jgi:cbb3-type cytochrome oxidase subunit 3
MNWIADHAGLIGLLFFFFVFLGVAVWLYLPGGRAKHEMHKFIPLSENGHD